MDELVSLPLSNPVWVVGKTGKVAHKLPHCLYVIFNVTHTNILSSLKFISSLLTSVTGRMVCLVLAYV